MNLLILTQKVDINDDVLGFFHGWLREFAKHCEQVTVICLMKGEYDLPENVKVLSLGKEAGKSRIKYLKNFYKYIWQERKNYDKVFVHMNAEYIVLGGWLWRLWGKKIYLWNNHKIGNLNTKISSLLVNKIFYTSSFANFAGHPKAMQMPVGIDSVLFKRNRNISREPDSVLSLGRISPIKNIDILIKAAAILKDKGINYKVNIVGAPSDLERDQKYFKELKNLVKKQGLGGKVVFIGGVPNFKTPEIYNKSEIYINLTNSGSLDKAILEAMMCECLTLVCNRTFKDIFPKEYQGLLLFKENDTEDLAEKLIRLLGLNSDKANNIAERLREEVARDHSQARLVKDLIKEMK